MGGSAAMRMTLVSDHPPQGKELGRFVADLHESTVSGRIQRGTVNFDRLGGPFDFTAATCS
jgi:hypothetical protein